MFFKMKKIQNSFSISGFIAKDAEIRQFATASVARFSLVISRTDNTGQTPNRTSAFMAIEAWRKNEHSEGLNTLTKGTLLTVEGYFKPEEWVDSEGAKHQRILMVATNFFPTPDEVKEEPKQPEKKTAKKKK